MHFKTAYAIMLLGTLLSACEMPTGPHISHQMGILEWRMRAPARERRWPSAQLLPSGTEAVSRASVAAPDTVLAGDPFTVTVTTIGANGCWQPTDASLELDEAAAVITPYDAVLSGPDIGCTDALKDLPHQVRVRFTRRGEAVLRVRGRRVTGSDFTAGEEVVVEKRIQVL